MTEALLLTLLAFTAPQDFQAPATIGGGNGLRFTGSPSARWDCGVCHDRGPDLTLEVRASPDTLFTRGYEPGKTYELALTLSEPNPLTSAFSLEILSRSGGVAGTLANLAPSQKCPTKFELIEIQAAGESAQSVACARGLSSWKLAWTAPATDTGSATLYAAAVVGDLSGDNTGDRSTARLVGIPSPSTINQRSSGCGAPAAALLIPFALIGLRRRRGAQTLVLLLVLMPAFAAAKARVKPKRPTPVGAAAAQPASAAPTAPSLAPDVPPAPPPLPGPQSGPPKVAGPLESPAPAAPPPPAPATVAATPSATVDPADEFSTAVWADVGTGLGFRNLAFYGSSFATPVRVQMGFPVVSASIGFRPMRLLRIHALEGLELEGRYQRGWVLGSLGLGAAAGLPADGRLTLGYVLELGPLTFAPRVVFRVQVGGVEKNFLFDDPWYQSVGGELALALHLGNFGLFARPQLTRVVDTGTLAETNYGKAGGGLSLGGEAGATWQLGHSGFLLGATYRLTHTTASWAGNGLRALGPVSSVDQVHHAELSVRFTR